MRELWSHAETLTRLPGAAGFEQRVVAWLAEAIGEVAEAIEVDALGNLSARLGPERGGARLLLCVHTDEVGLLVTHILPGGEIGFRLHGRIDRRVLPAARVQVCGRDGQVNGVVVIRSAHLVTAEEAARAPQDLWIDVGARSATEVADLGIRVGQPVVYAHSWEQLGAGRIAAKTLDNRVGCALLLCLAQAVAGRKRDFTLQLLFATQEEIGSRSAQVAAHRLRPDLALVIDTVAAADYATPAERSITRIGGGPVIRTADSLPTMIGTVYSGAASEHLRGTAERLGVAWQEEVTETWTDAATVHTSGDGVPCAGLFVPRLNAHAPIEIIERGDLEGAYRLTEAFVQELDGATLERLTRFLPAFSPPRRRGVEAERTIG